MRIFGILTCVAFMFGLSSAQAALVQVNLATLGVVGYSAGSCYCGGGPTYGAYYGKPGDIVDFGTYTFTPVADTHSFERNPQCSNPNYPDEFKIMGYNVGNYYANFTSDPIPYTAFGTNVVFKPYLLPPPGGETINLV